MKSKNKVIAAIAATSAMAMALSGCGGSATEGSGSDAPALAPKGEKVSITLNWWGSDARVKLTESAVKRFEAANPNIHVDMQYSDWGGYWDKLATSVAGDNAPDVMQMDESYFSSYASQGSLYDLSKVSKFLDFGNMSVDNKKAGQIERKQYAAETSVTLDGVIVNMDILEKLGITLPDTSAWTWKQYEDVCQQVVDKSNGEYVGTQPTFGGYDFQLWQRQHGKRSMFTGNKVSIDKKLMADYMQKAYDWTHGKNPIAGSPDKWSEQFSAVNGTLQDTDMAKGKQALSFGSGGLSSQLAQYAKALGTENFKIVPMPADRSASKKYYYMKPGMYWSISAKSKHPAESAKLIDFLINDDQTGKEFGTDRGIPTNKKVRKELAATANPLDKQLFDFVDQMSRISGDNPDPTPNGASGFTNAFLRKLQDVVFDKSKPDKAAEELVSEIQNSVDTAS